MPSLTLKRYDKKCLSINLHGKYVLINATYRQKHRVCMFVMDHTHGPSHVASWQIAQFFICAFAPKDDYITGFDCTPSKS
jgi:hypothetical protein